MRHSSILSIFCGWGLFGSGFFFALCVAGEKDGDLSGKWFSGQDRATLPLLLANCVSRQGFRRRIPAFGAIYKGGGQPALGRSEYANPCQAINLRTSAIERATSPRPGWNLLACIERRFGAKRNRAGRRPWEAG